MNRITFCLMLFFVTAVLTANGQQQPLVLLQQVKAKMDKVDNYIADGHMKTNVSFLKVPESNVKVYFKKPGKLKIVNENGISIVPKGAVTFTLNNVLNTDKYTAIDAGTDVIGNKKVQVIKLIPTDDNSEIVLSTLYIDPANKVVLKAKTTSRDNGTYELEMVYGNYIAYALADKVLFTFNIKEYKLPKGVTFDYDDGTKSTKKAAAPPQTKGKVEIAYSKYNINKGFNDDVFK